MTNAWSLKIIDYLHKVANKESLQVAGTSLDVSARVLGVRIDNVHTEGMQLASSIIKSANKPSEEHGTENGMFDIYFIKTFALNVKFNKLLSAYL